MATSRQKANGLHSGFEKTTWQDRYVSYSKSHAIQAGSHCADSRFAFGMAKGARRVRKLLGVLVILGAGCRHPQQPLYQICWVGQYTNDLHCGSPLPRYIAIAHMQAQKGDG